MKSVLTGIALYAMFFGGYFKGYLGPLGTWITGHYGWTLMIGLAVIDFCGALFLHRGKTGRWWWQEETVKESPAASRTGTRRPHFVIPSELETDDATESEFNIELSETHPRTLPPSLSNNDTMRQAGGGRIDNGVSAANLPPLSRPEIVVESEHSHDAASDEEDWFEEEQPSVVDKLPQEARGALISDQGAFHEESNYEDKN